MSVNVSKSKESGAGIGIGGVVQIVFIILKLCGLIDWSWWWVFSPSLICLGLVLLVLIIFILQVSWEAD